MPSPNSAASARDQYFHENIFTSVASAASAKYPSFWHRVSKACGAIMHHMKTLKHLLLAATATASLATAQAQFYVELGVSRFQLEDANPPPSPIQVIAAITTSLRSQDKHATAPRLTLGYKFTDLVSLRANYSHLRNIGTQHREVYLTGGQTVFTFDTREDINVFTVGPEFQWKRNALSFFATPYLTWTQSRQQTDFSTTIINFAPGGYPENTRATEDSLTFSAEAGARYALSEKLSASFSYSYHDLDAAYGRTGQALNLSLRFQW